MVVVPTIDTVEEAIEARNWTYFPPLGRRSAGGGQAFEPTMWGRVPGGYRNTINDNVVLILMIETLEGMKNAAAIAKVPGVTAVFAASGDLGNFSGYRQGSPDYERRINVVHDAALNAKVRLCGPLAWRNRPAIRDGYQRGCRATHCWIPWQLDPEVLRGFGPGWDPDADPVELYYLPDDFAQARNLAEENPEKVDELRKLFWEEADRYQVLPILGGLSSFYGIVPPIPKESKFTYRGRIENVSAGMIPRIYNHSYTIGADLVVPEGGVEGVIVAAFDHLGGFALYVQDGKLKHHYSMLGVLEYTQESETALPSGEVSVEMVFAADEPKPATGGEVTLLVNGEPVATGRMEHTVPARFSGYAGMDIGCDNGLVVDRSYADKAPFRFTGEIKQVTFDIAPHMSEDDMQALHEHAAQALAAHAASA